MTKHLALVISIFCLFSCKKDSSSEVDNPANKPDISAVPAHFNQKILLEEFTSSICGQCPEAHLLRDSLLALYPGRLYCISTHVTDPMIDLTITNLSTGTNTLDSIFNPAGIYPSGMLNRQVAGISDLVPANWGTSIITQLGAVPRCGLALDAKSIDAGDVLTLTVYTGFSDTMAGDYRLHVFLVENVVHSHDSIYDQMNDFSINGTSPDSTSSLYLLDDTIPFYSHRYVLQRILNDYGVDGDAIPVPLMTPGKQYVKGYLVNLNGIDITNSYIIAFVDKYGTNGTSHRIENVQRVNIGEAKDWN